MEKNFLKKKIRKSKTFGTWLTISNSNYSEIFAKYFDFLIIDTEHGNFNNQQIVDIIRSCELNKCSPIIRVSKNLDNLILSALDLGAHGIITPKVENKKDLKNIIESCYYAPIGKRGYSGFVRSFDYNKDISGISNEDANNNILNIILIETKEGLKNLPDLLKSKYVDIVYLGYYDLSQSLKLDLKKDWKEMLEILSKTIKLIRKNNKHVGIMALNENHLKTFADLKASFIPYMVDCSILEDQLSKLKISFNKFA